MKTTRTGLVLPVGRLCFMALAFRLGRRPATFGFRPGVKSLLVYECGRLVHRVYERERVSYYLHRLRVLRRRLWRV